jgi:hypothetical protein
LDNKPSKEQQACRRVGTSLLKNRTIQSKEHPGNQRRLNCKPKKHWETQTKETLGNANQRNIGSIDKEMIGMRRKFWLGLAVVIGFALGVQGQTKTETGVLNDFIRYSNENIHGMLIVHRLIELYNQEINKYMDKEGYPLNFISNEDFEENIFEDHAQIYYRISPHTLLASARQGSSQLAPDSKKGLLYTAQTMKNITDSLNNIRFSIERNLAVKDLTVMDNLKALFQQLEQVADLYDRYESSRKELLRWAQPKGFDPSPKSLLYQQFYEWSVHLNAVFDVLRKEQKLSAPQAKAYREKSEALEKALSAQIAQKGAATSVQYLESTLDRLKQTRAAIEEYLKQTAIPEEYKLYGAPYFYYNVRLASLTNKYGSGTFYSFNQWLQREMPEMLLIAERPHFYKVLYPKERAKLEVSASNVPDNAPKNIENRTVVMSRSKVIKAPTDKLRIELFDHQEIDGDIVSINYNGKWILRNYTLQRKPRIMILPVEKGDNFLVLYAENLGAKPPNTMAIKYIEKGEMKTLVLNSDLNHSEMIVIRSDW